MVDVSDTINCQRRQAGSKGMARTLRSSGMVPGVLYGPAVEPTPITLNPRAFVQQRRTFGRAHTFKLELDGEQTFDVFIQSIDTDPVSGAVMHVDLYHIDPNRAVSVDVRIELQGRPLGVSMGGALVQRMHTIRMHGLPKIIPDVIYVDVSHLNVGDSVHVRDLTFAEGLQSMVLGGESIAAVPEVQKEEVLTPAEAAKAAAAAAAAAPAAGGKAPAGKAPAGKAPAGKAPAGKAPAKSK